MASRLLRIGLLAGGLIVAGSGCAATEETTPRRSSARPEGSAETPEQARAAGDALISIIDACKAYRSGDLDGGFESMRVAQMQAENARPEIYDSTTRLLSLLRETSEERAHLAANERARILGRIVESFIRSVEDNTGTHLLD